MTSGAADLTNIAALRDNKARGAIDALTSLRFFAAAAVLLFHSGSHVLVAGGYIPWPVQNIIRNGYLGVSFFFVLSGFILTYVYQGAMSKAGSLGRFYAARFARVYPVYALSILLMAPITPDVIGMDTLPQFFLLQMWLPLKDGYFQNWNGPCWTLSVELLFYLTFPIWLSLFNRLSTRQIGYAAIALSIILIAGRLSGISDTVNVTSTALSQFPVPFLRLPEFVFGICLGLLLLREGHSAEAPWAPHFCIALTAVVLAASQSLWIAPFATISFGALIFSTAAWLRAGLLERFLSSRIMVLLGGASYSLYLLQSPAREWLRVLAAGSWETAARIAYQPMLVVLSIFVFLWFEEPARRWLKLRART